MRQKTLAEMSTAATALTDTFIATSYWISDERRERRPFASKSLAQALTEAYEDLKVNWRDYLERFKRAKKLK